MELALQGSLLGGGEPSIDAGFGGLAWTALGPCGDAWVDLVPGWLRGPDTLFAHLVDTLDWQGRLVPMYEQMVDQPRLTARLAATSGADVAVIEAMRAALGARYGRDFTGVGCNLYRDGHDSVAWHGDRVARDLAEAGRGDRFARGPAPVPAAPDPRWPLGALRAPLGRPARDGRVLPADVAALRAQGRPSRAKDQRDVPPRV